MSSSGSSSVTQENLVHAISVVLSPLAAHPDRLKATHWLESLKKNESAWGLCMGVLKAARDGAGVPHAVALFVSQLLLHRVRKCRSPLGPEEVQEMVQVMVTFPDFPPALKHFSLAVCSAALRAEWWQPVSIFDDLIRLCSGDRNSIFLTALLRALPEEALAGHTPSQVPPSRRTLVQSVLKGGSSRAVQILGDAARGGGGEREATIILEAALKWVEAGGVEWEDIWAEERGRPLLMLAFAASNAAQTDSCAFQAALEFLLTLVETYTSSCSAASVILPQLLLLERAVAKEGSPTALSLLFAAGRVYIPQMVAWSHEECAAVPFVNLIELLLRCMEVLPMEGLCATYDCWVSLASALDVDCSNADVVRKLWGALERATLCLLRRLRYPPDDSWFLHMDDEDRLEWKAQRSEARDFLRTIAQVGSGSNAKVRLAVEKCLVGTACAEVQSYVRSLGGVAADWRGAETALHGLSSIVKHLSYTSSLDEMIGALPSVAKYFPSPLMKSSLLLIAGMSPTLPPSRLPGAFHIAMDSLVLPEEQMPSRGTHGMRDRGQDHVGAVTITKLAPYWGESAAAVGPDLPLNLTRAYFETSAALHSHHLSGAQHYAGALCSGSTVCVLEGLCVVLSSNPARSAPLAREIMQQLIARLHDAVTRGGSPGECAASFSLTALAVVIRRLAAVPPPLLVLLEMGFAQISYRPLLRQGDVMAAGCDLLRAMAQSLEAQQLLQPGKGTDDRAVSFICSWQDEIMPMHAVQPSAIFLHTIAVCLEMPSMRELVLSWARNALEPVESAVASSAGVSECLLLPDDLFVAVYAVRMAWVCNLPSQAAPLLRGWLDTALLSLRCGVTTLKPARSLLEFLRDCCGCSKLNPGCFSVEGQFISSVASSCSPFTTQLECCVANGYGVALVAGLLASVCGSMPSWMLDDVTATLRVVFERFGPLRVQRWIQEALSTDNYIQLTGSPSGDDQNTDFPRSLSEYFATKQWRLFKAHLKKYCGGKKKAPSQSFLAGLPPSLIRSSTM